MGRARAFAGRRSRLLSLVEHARRSEGSGALADPGDHRSPRQEARRRRRPAGQELALAASAGAPQRPRSQETGDGRLRRAAAAVGKGVARRNRRHADVLEFLRRPRKQGIHPRDRDGSRRESPRGEGAGSARRLHLRPRVGRAQRLDPRALPRPRRPGQGRSHLVASRMAAVGAAHPRYRLGRARDLPSALRRRHRAPVARHRAAGCAGVVSRARRDRRRGARRAGTRARGRHLLPAGCPGVNMGVRLVSLALLIAAWYADSQLAGARLLPDPQAGAPAAGGGDRSRTLAFTIGATLARVAAAFVVAMALGSVIGLIMGRWRIADRLGDPWLIVLLNLPALVIIVLAYVWAGLTETAAIAAWGRH